VEENVTTMPAGFIGHDSPMNTRERSELRHTHGTLLTAAPWH
jgi:hypothetical protein